MAIRSIFSTNKDTWIAAYKGLRWVHYQRYNEATNEFELIGRGDILPLFKPILFGDDLICFFIGSRLLVQAVVNQTQVKGSGFYNQDKRLQDLEELTIEIIDHEEVISSLDFKLTKDLYFKTAAKIDENMIIFGTSQGIINYRNGEFHRNDEFRLIQNKKVNNIIVLQNKKTLIICEGNEVFLFEEGLTQLDFNDGSQSIINFIKDVNGDVFLTTGKSVYWIKTSSINNKVIKIASDLNNCVAVYQLDNTLYLICDDGIVTVTI